MSSNSTSPPRTPSKRNMAVEKPARTPLPNGTSSDKPNGIVATALENIEKPGNHVQVPSSQPPVAEVTVVKDIQMQNGHQNGQANEDHAPSSTVASDQDPGELPPFDWKDFRDRYDAELRKLNGDEEELVENFDKLAQVSSSVVTVPSCLADLNQSFTYWTESASNRDNARGMKR